MKSIEDIIKHYKKDGEKMENKVRHLIGTKCPDCIRGQLKKKYNRQVKPAKPFLGCTSFPKCSYSLEMDGTHLVKEDENFDPFDSYHPHSASAHGQY